MQNAMHDFTQLWHGMLILMVMINGIHICILKAFGLFQKNSSTRKFVLYYHLKVNINKIVHRFIHM
jgi:hypothetical protein